ncbi:MAG: DUF3078 domain-containing protein [Muribaculaceae bacterium]|nr:DUF3078 domain-containing protein [Muribaculaceae bacterium]
MKHIIPYCLSILTGMSLMPLAANAHSYHLEGCETCAQADSLYRAQRDSLVVSNPTALFDSMPQPAVNYDITNLSLIPKVFSGYQAIRELPKFSKKGLTYSLGVATPYDETESNLLTDENGNLILPENLLPSEEGEFPAVNLEEAVGPEEDNGLPSIMKYSTPQWLRDAVARSLSQEDLLYSYMIDNPEAIEYAYWDLPLPPVLLEEDRSFLAFLNKQDVPDVNPAEADIQVAEIRKVHWLHKMGSQLQFSQAYVSPNWYQGGNSYLSMLFNFNWNVQLNQVYHPKILFTSDFQYKVAFSSNPKGYMHKYTIAEDNFQYNLNLGLKAVKDWYYSYNLQFKTQLFNNFEENSNKRTAAFLSPADLNMGLGMTYNHTNKLKTLSINLTVSPLSYNLKACLKPNYIIDHAAYGIAADKHTKSEIGSNLDFTMDWKITPNIGYKTRVFMFTDYHYYLFDWQNTFNFEINKFLSTQLFVHMRYDGSAESYGKWKRFMLREILSFGLSYTFSTKP